jgi:hypothetical protein
VQHHPTVPPDGDPYVTTTPTDGTTISALCLVGRCATCKGAVLSLVHPVGTRCTHQCHLPAAWADQVVAFPPCSRDGAAYGLAALFCWLILDQLRRDRATS